MRTTTEISRTLLSKMKLAPNSNFVLVRVKSNDGRKTDGGIIIAFNDEVQYSEGSGSHMADMAEVHGTVVLCPDKLYYNPEDPYSMSWLTDMAIKVGDEVWFNFIASTHCSGFIIDGELYLFILYADLFIAKRGDEVIPLNGYVFLTEVKKETTSFLYIAGEDKVDMRRGVVRYVGEPNREYRISSFSDGIDITEGDKVQIRSGFTPYYLERHEYLADFGEKLLVVQRRNIEFSYGKD